jgi:hypothetical protein
MRIYEEVQVVAGTAADLATAADLGRLVAGYVGFTVRAIAAVVTEVVGTAPASVELDFQPTAGSASGRVNHAIMTIPLAASVGDVFYRDGLDLRVDPGEAIVIETDGDATSTGAVAVTVYLERHWEQPANFPVMTEALT